MLSASRIAIRGARQNNLAGVDVDIPRERLVAITGVSGSGKSSLAFDTLFREGQRRFLETLSAYARQFLGQMEKPEVDHIEGLSPAIAVDQNSIQRGPRSTVGTLTEIHDYLRVLYARAGTAHCPEHGTPLRAQTSEAIAQAVLASSAGEAVLLLAPLVRDRKGEHRALFEELARKGYVRVRVDGAVHRLEAVPALERYKRHRIELVVDRLTVEAASLARLRESVAAALEQGSGDLIVAGPAGERAYSSQRTCPSCGREAPPLEPRMFSFNSPHGACTRCQGLGVLRAPREDLVVADARLSLRRGALAVTRASGGGLSFPRVDFRFLAEVGKRHGFDLDTPWEKLSAAARRVVLHGAGEETFRDQASWKGETQQGRVRWQHRYAGVLPALEAASRKGAQRRAAQRFLDERACDACDGTRLSELALAVRVGPHGMRDFLMSPVARVGALLEQLALPPREAAIARELVGELRRRSAFLDQVGLGYLALGRSADTLSGGEAQRIRLAAQLGSGLQGVLYVLDEPSIGLHPIDHERLLAALRALRDAGNSVVVVEHDEATLRAADWLIDVGPLAGRGGGRIVAAGTPDEVALADSPTGKLLRGELRFPAPNAPRPGNGSELVVRGARAHNLKDVDVRIPLGALVAVSGVSGSGKSSLVEGVLWRALERHLGREAPAPLEHARVEGMQAVGDLVAIDASPIGRTPRSNPATYAEVFTPVRELFASLPESRVRGWGPGRFSFNVAGGRCETCQGAGAQYVELQFLAPVTVPCPECGGQRFQAETLDARYRGKSIADVLAATIDEALALFKDHPKIARPLEALVEVGLGYLTLGQPSTTLSGGEAQRVKLALHLQKRTRVHTLYLLDEPTSGLHQADVQRLVGALQRLVDAGHSVLVVEHNLDLLRACDHLIELGPGPGEAGGALVGSGTPAEFEARGAAADASPTARALREQARAGKRSRGARARTESVLREAPVAREHIEIRGARTHNLQQLDLDLPRDRFIVVTGVSGSGKSSLALDTIHAAGRARFVESLSTYARQFLGQRDRPPVDRIDGLGPSVAVEARGYGSHPRSSVATSTEIHDHLRVLWARAGTPRCPEHGQPLERYDAAQAARRVLAAFGGKKGWIAAPLPPIAGKSAKARAAAWKDAREGWRAGGFVRLLVDGAEARLEELVEAPAAGASLALAIDRIAFAPSARARLAEAIEQASGLAHGHVLARTTEGEQLALNLLGACTRCGFALAEPLQPRHFSFNTHVGACPTCDGLGESWRADGAKLVDHPQRPLLPSDPGAECAIGGKLGRYLLKGKGFYEHLLRAVAREHGLDLAKPFAKLGAAQRELVLHGTGARGPYQVKIEKHGETFELEQSYEADWPGLCGHVDAWHAKAEDPGWRAVLEGFMSRASCRACQGERLAPAARAVELAGTRLPQLLALSIEGALEWVRAIALPPAVAKATQALVLELRTRLELLERVGLGYVRLDRPTSTLSSGEARRARLASSLGSRLVGVCYVLDEPTVGLHPQDVDRLCNALLELREQGNTVIAVEHDEHLMRRADWIVDMGPGAGRRGGRVVVAGPPAALEACPDSLTGRALSGELRPRRTSELRERAAAHAHVPELVLSGARLHNLKGVELRARYGELTGICGPSGSGKSTLVLDVLVPALRGEAADGRWNGLAGSPVRTLVIDSAPLGRSPASVPATAVGVMDPLRELYARTPEARSRGYTVAAFSFNSAQGRCPACEGKGATLVEMQFLADLWLGCEQCGGKRYRPEVLDVRWRERSIAEVLAMSAEEALDFFAAIPTLVPPLRALVDVGLGYLVLGQSTLELSAGEAQRVKLAAELLSARAQERSLVILDEPTSGLSTADVCALLGVLERLAARGDAVIVIEHNLGLLAACDRLIELGPGGGEAGGELIARGTPEELARDARSVTGPWLRGALELAPQPASSGRAPRRPRGERRTEVRA